MLQQQFEEVSLHQEQFDAVEMKVEQIVKDCVHFYLRDGVAVYRGARKFVFVLTNIPVFAPLWTA
jgi:hypothetical protein